MTLLERPAMVDGRFGEGEKLQMSHEVANVVRDGLSL
jgi:hypothetical protein